MRKAEWFRLIDGMAPDEGQRLAPEDREQALALAVIRYSTDRPRIEAADVVTPDGYTVPLPEGWGADFSRVTCISIPAATPVGPHRALPSDGWQPCRIPGRDVLLLVRPEKTGATLRLHFTLPHVLPDEDDGPDTIPATDREAVAHWAAALLLDTLAGKHAGDMQSTINSDSVDHAAKMPNYKALAEAQRQLYWNHLGIDPKRAVAAGAVVKVGHGRLLHRGPRNRRRT